MALNSMTGFARTEGRSERCTWVWEAKSVNGKGLDVRLRLPHGFERLEAPARDQAKKGFQRGNISMTLAVNWERGASTYRIDDEVLESVLGVLPDLQSRMPDAAPPTLDGLLALRGVIEAVEEPMGEDEQADLESAIMASLGELLSALAAARAEEGTQLHKLISGQLSRMSELTDEAATLAALRPDAIKTRLNEQVKELAGSVSGLTEERLAQEVAILMLKADVREELDRLRAHMVAARELIGDGGAVGRRFDFLCQEFNREANTLCSKSGDVQLTQVGLELKTLIDQMREQVQNVE